MQYLCTEKLFVRYIPVAQTAEYGACNKIMDSILKEYVNKWTDKMHSLNAIKVALHTRVYDMLESKRN